MAAALLLAAALLGGSVSAEELLLDRSEGGQPFYGVGGLSGGGATSRLLVDYVEPQRSQILDYLFKPNYGASLHILKVEMGGDSQSTDGTEPSHMHSADDLDYNRGYEWWLLTEAKKRNPEIKTYGLPWAFPGWVGGPEQSGSPFKHPELTSKYILKWLEGARKVYGVEIDYIGIWNERASDGTYAKTLRKILDEGGFTNTTLVAKDGGADICDEMAKDKEYAEAIGVVGLHYPSDYSNYEICRKIGFGVKGGKPIWSSEESSSYDDLNGAACWARIIAAHWVLQGFSSSIMWNLVGAYYHGTNWYASSMLTAVQPWSGHFEALEVVWATAHVTQFTKVGWSLLEVGSGSGQLPHGGFYTTYIDPHSDDWTLVAVKIDHDHAPCTRPPLPWFKVSGETVTFRLAPSMKAKTLAVWYSNFQETDGAGRALTVFKRLSDIQASDGTFELEMPLGAVYTVSTILKGPTKGEPDSPVPESQPSLPLPYFEDFDSYAESQEGKWWADQIGVFEVHKESGSTNKVMRQMVPELPIGWSDGGSRGPVSILGMKEWQDISIEVAFKMPVGLKPGASACVGTRVDQMWRTGLVLCVSIDGNWSLSVGGPKLGNLPKGFATGVTAALTPGSWNRLSLTTVGSQAWASLEAPTGTGKKSLFDGISVPDLGMGFVAMGANDWFAVEFDSASVKQAGPNWHPTSPCPGAAVGTRIQIRRCAANGLAVEDQGFELLPNWGLRHVKSGLCAAVEAPAGIDPSKAGGAKLSLAACNATDTRQQFHNDYTTVRNQWVPIRWAGFVLTSSPGNSSVTLAKMQQAGKASGLNQFWMYYPNTKQLRSQGTKGFNLDYPLCLSTCVDSSPVLAEYV